MVGPLANAEEIRRISERLQLAAEAAEIGIWSWTPGTPEMEVDTTWRRLFGHPPHTRITFDAWRGTLHPDDRERTVKELNAAVEQHGDFNTEYRAIGPDGTLRWLADRGRASYDENGRAASVAGVTLDITARKQAEEARRQEEERLHRLNRALRAIPET